MQALLTDVTGGFIGKTVALLIRKKGGKKKEKKKRKKKGFRDIFVHLRIRRDGSVSFDLAGGTFV